MKLRITSSIIALSLVIVSFINDDKSLFKTPEGWQKPVYDFTKNPLTKERIALGRKLFYDPILSKDNTISCSSCHLSHTAFTHIDHQLSHGIKGKIGTRNSPALMNLAWQNSFMWDGSINHLDMQSLAPITHPDEMGETIENVIVKLQKTEKYPTIFKQAYGDSMITGANTLKAISQFMLTLVSAESKYDKVMSLRGVAMKEAKQAGDKNVAFNQYELKGYDLFKTHCASCHREPLFMSNSFENNGLEPDKDLLDGGRIKVTKRKEDSLKFKVPTLRNIEVTYPYMHDGRFPNLQMVLFHYTEGVHQSETLAPALKKKIILSEEDKRNLIAFLKTLTDEDFLHNPKFQYAP
jgi:cytochrome c peroxidase